MTKKQTKLQPGQLVQNSDKWGLGAIIHSEANKTKTELVAGTQLYTPKPLEILVVLNTWPAPPDGFSYVTKVLSAGGVGYTWSSYLDPI